MSNKNERTKIESDNDNSMKVNTKGRIRFNVVDFFIILFVVASLVSIAYFVPEVANRFSSQGEAEITYVLEFRGVDDAFITNIQNNDGVFDASQGFSMGKVKAVATESYSTLEYNEEDGQANMIDHPTQKTLVITVTVSAVYTEGEGYSVHGERIAVGSKYDVRFPNYSGTAYCTQVKLNSN